MRASQYASVVAILAVGASLGGCADISFGSLGSTDQHSFVEGNSSTSEPRDEDRPFARSSLRGSIDERESKLSGLDDRSTAALRKPEEVALAEQLNPQVVSDDRFLQCVRFVQEVTGIDIRGNANRWWDLAKGHYERSHRPEEGSILVMRGWRSDRRGHVAVVKEILDNRTIVVDHANWLNDGRIYLNAPVRDESAKNDWSKVRVWYTPGEHWGQRVYKAKGFIYPDEAVAENRSPRPVYALSR